MSGSSLNGDLQSKTGVEIFMLCPFPLLRSIGGIHSVALKPFVLVLSAVAVSIVIIL